MSAPTTQSPGGAGNTPYVADLGGSLNQIIDDPGNGTTYVCHALPGTLSSDAKWRVQRIVVNGFVTTISFAGTGAFDQVADNRAALSY